jgi:hypothetical protein
MSKIRRTNRGLAGDGRVADGEVDLVIGKDRLRISGNQNLERAAGKQMFICQDPG